LLIEGFEVVVREDRFVGSDDRGGRSVVGVTNIDTYMVAGIPKYRAPESSEHRQRKQRHRTGS
jgi:hypothetical protein